MLHTKIRNNQTLGDITIELQRPNSSGILETYATYLYSNAQAASVEDSAATGVLPSQKLEFVYQSVQVTVDKKTETDDWAAPVAG